jgi:hypothetical protein
MKLKKLIRKTTVIKKVGKVTEVWHQQSIRPSIAFNSGEAQYGVRIECEDHEVKAAIKRAEAIVQPPLLNKLSEIRIVLCDLAKDSEKFKGR